MKVANNINNLKESLTEIENAIKAGLETKQRTIGFHTSAACVDMLEIYLHKLNLLSDDYLIKHEWLASKNKISEKLGFEFRGKGELLKLIKEVEIKRNNFCYGKKKSFNELSQLIEDFNKVKHKFEELGADLKEETNGEQ